MNGYAARYEETGLTVVAVDIKESEATVAAFADQLHAIFPMALDADGSAAAAWDAVVLPVHYWIGADGIIKAGAAGGIGPDTMATGLQSILPGVDVAP
jgi:peroxiredoxin